MLSTVVGFVVFIAVGGAVHFLAIELHAAWWERSAPGQPIPQSAMSALNWAVPGLFGLLAGKFVGDRV